MGQEALISLTERIKAKPSETSNVNLVQSIVHLCSVVAGQTSTEVITQACTSLASLLASSRFVADLIGYKPIGLYVKTQNSTPILSYLVGEQFKSFLSFNNFTFSAENYNAHRMLTYQTLIFGHLNSMVGNNETMYTKNAIPSAVVETPLVTQIVCSTKIGAADSVVVTIHGSGLYLVKCISTTDLEICQIKNKVLSNNDYISEKMIEFTVNTKKNYQRKMLKKN